MEFFTLEYESVGCFHDKSNRAISGGSVDYHTDLIKSCYLKAKREGNEYFAVQDQRQCFTSPSAGKTYSKYGTASGCANGKGGSWKSNVYRITTGILFIFQYQTIAGGRYIVL